MIIKNQLPVIEILYIAFIWVYNALFYCWLCFVAITAFLK